MGIEYYRLFDLLTRRGIKKGDLAELADISRVTVTKLGKNGVVQTDILERICEVLDCQPADIMEYVKDEKD